MLVFNVQGALTSNFSTSKSFFFFDRRYIMVDIGFVTIEYITRLT